MRYDRRLVGCLIIFVVLLLTSFVNVDAGEVTGRIFEKDGKQVRTKNTITVMAYEVGGMAAGMAPKNTQAFDPTDHLIIDVTAITGNTYDLSFFRNTDLTKPVLTITGLRSKNKKSHVIDVVFPPGS